VQRFDNLLDSVGRLARRGALPNALNIIEKLRPVEVATVLRSLGKRERTVVFEALAERDPAKAAEAVTELGTEYARELLTRLPPARIIELLGAISSDDAALLVPELSDEVRDEVLARLNAEQVTGVHELLTFETETAGRIMTPEYFALEEETTVSEAVAALQRRSEEFEMSFYVYVVDVRNHLVGVVSLRQLLLNTPSTPLRKIMSTDVIKVATSADQEEVARLVAYYNLLALPVVDAENKLVGIVTVDDIIDVIREEATEDIYALAGVDADDRALGSTLNSVRRRLPWLLTSLGTALLAAAIVNASRGELEAAIVLAIVMPVVILMGTSAASQTMVVVVRGIGLNEVSWDRLVPVVLKEALVGLANGALVGALAGLVIGAWFRSFAVAFAVGASLVLNSVLACLVGTLVPLSLKRARFDPAIASSVFVITITVVIGLLVYLAIGRLVVTGT
jgi:magnesium transporter